MAQIREELVLHDKFTQTFTRYIRLGEQAAGATNQAKRAVDQFTKSQKSAATASNALTNSIRGLVGGYLSLRGIQAVLNMSDTLVSTRARIDMMNDGLQTTEELNQMIYESAQRSRGAYAETAAFVAKLGNLAGDAFDSSAEIVAFAEQINKQMVLSGTTTQEARAAMLQLTQGLSSGTLRGEELVSVLEQTPMIAKTIADYMGVTTGEMRELASEGKLTAEVVKNAMFAAAEETNAKFEEMPMTWGQAWSQIKNTALMSIQDMSDALSEFINSDTGAQMIKHVISGFELLGRIGSKTVSILTRGAQWISDNWTAVSAVLTAVAVVMGTYLVASAIKSGVAFLTAYWPLALIVGILTLIIYMALQMGATWEQVGGVIGGVFGYIYAVAVNTVVPIWNMFAALANFVGNVFHDPVAAVKVLFLDLASNVLGHMSTVAHAIEDLINKIPGLHVNLTSGLDSLLGYVQNKSAAVKDASEWKEYVGTLDYVDYADSISSGYSKGASLATSAQTAMEDVSSIFSGASYSPYDEISSQLDDISSNVGSINKSVSMSEEDLESLVDVAERRYVNNINLTSQTPVINITGQNTGNTAADRQGLANAIRDILVSQAASGSIRSTAHAF